MELSGGLVPGLKPAGRKSSTVVRYHSEWPLRVQCDGQPGASHTGSLYQGFLGLCLDFFFFPCFSLTQCSTCKHTNFSSHKCLFFFPPPLSLRPRDSDVATLALLCKALTLLLQAVSNTSVSLASSCSCTVVVSGRRLKWSEV